MSRLSRLDFHGAIHLAQLRGREGFNICFDASVLVRSALERGRSTPHLLHFFRLLDTCCTECGAQLFGYCVEPNAASLVMRTLGAPLNAFMQRLGGRYSRHLHQTDALPVHVSAFGARYLSKIVAPEYLPHAVRRVHERPVRGGLARRAVDYPFSSARAYLGERAAVHLETDVLRRALELKGLFGPRGYLKFMEKAETPHVAALFERGSPLDARVVGGPVFVAHTKDIAGHPPAPITREQLFASVAQLLGTESDPFLGDGHQAVLARALVAWQALQSGTASIREVATWFGVSAATLARAIRHYRKVSPALFEQMMPGIEPRNSNLED